MNARTYIAATIVAVFCGVQPAEAADSRLINLIMPDANVVAGVSVERAKATPFGQYVLAQISPHDQEIQKLITTLGFDPRTDVSEMLVASYAKPKPPAAGGGAAVATHPQSGLALATGIFNVAKIAEAAKSAKGQTEIYNGVTVFEDPSGKQAVAFLDGAPQIAIFGDVASVKAAIDRRGNATAGVSPELAGLISRWSATQDAWFAANVPPSLLKPPVGAGQFPGAAQQTVFQTVRNLGGGINFNVQSNVVLSIEANSDTAQNAASIAGALQLLANMGQLQASKDPKAASLLKSLAVTSQANVVLISLRLPADQFQQLVTPKPKPATKSRRNSGSM
jgi:hypothetical protein